MAFRQPQQRPQNARQVSFPPNVDQADASPLASPLRKRALADSEEWILFSPSQAASTAHTETTSTERTPRTVGLSQFSDFGSLDTAAPSDQIEDEVEGNDGLSRDGDDITEHGSDVDEEAELDSLDDDLHAFHDPERLDQSGAAVLPTHDGLGTFGEASAAVQQQLWRFERPIAKRKLRRTSSVQRTLDALEEVDEITQQGDRVRRIEQWRLEQSRALLEEIERETRRMHRIGRVGSARSRANSSANTQPRSETQQSPNVATAAPSASHPSHMQPTGETADTEVDTESFWQRFTHKVIRSLIGIDENLLSIILGEDLVQEAHSQAPVEAEPLNVNHVVSLENRESHVSIEETWQHRLMVRIAKELGFLVHQMSEHPGAFSTYLRTQETPAYAGLPCGNGTRSGVYDTACHNQRSSSPTFFKPTIRAQQSNKAASEASLWGIEEEGDELEEILARGPPFETGDGSLRAEREYWERELDVKMVFKFLKNRFSSPPDSPVLDALIPVASPNNMESRRLSTTSAISVPSSARRAALIRQQHPLAARNHDSGNRRRSVLSQPTATLTTAQAGFARTSHRIGKTTASSSCASQSTKKSKRSGSSRNYWDHAGSVNSGPAGAAGIGAWGEVAM